MIKVAWHHFYADKAHYNCGFIAYHILLSWKKSKSLSIQIKFDHMQNNHIRYYKSILIMLIMATLFASCDPATVRAVMDGEVHSKAPLSDEQIIAGLKEALKQGTTKAVQTTSAVDGFWKNPKIRIPFPDEAIQVKNKLMAIGFSSQVETFEATLNHAAEKAAEKAIPVFVDAITKMTVQDAYHILHGDSIAATSYLKSTTTNQLREQFRPVVQNAIDQVKLTSYWEPLATAYNTANIITGQKAVNPDLTAYVTDKALEGLFYYVGQEEKRIRKDPQARITDILKKVFGATDGKS